MHKAGAGHVGGPLSATDLLISLYFAELRIDPDRPEWPDRDRFILSKGHSSIGLYSVMAMRGYFPIEELETFDQIDSRLQGHPDMTRLPGLDMSTGSFGQGLSPGVGMAIGARLSGKDFRTWVMLGDGEIQEGQIWEAAFTAVAIRPRQPRRHRRLQPAAPVRLAQGGEPGNYPRTNPIDDPAAKFRAFGWRTVECNGHDYAEIRDAFAVAKETGHGPCCIVAHTIKGKGVSFMEGDHLWHAKAPEQSHLDDAMRELFPDRSVESRSTLMTATTALTATLPLLGAQEVPMRDAWGQAMADLANEYPDLVVLDGDLANSTRADIFADAHPDRFFEMGIAEQNMIGVAAGLATVGYVPWISTFAAFVAKRALDQIRVVVAQPHLNVKLCGSYSGILTSKTGKTHQSVEDIAIFRAMPGVTTIVPADVVELRTAMRAMMENPGPGLPSPDQGREPGDLRGRLPVRDWQGPPASGWRRCRDRQHGSSDRSGAGGGGHVGGRRHRCLRATHPHNQAPRPGSDCRAGRSDRRDRHR